MRFVNMFHLAITAFEQRDTLEHFDFYLGDNFTKKHSKMFELFRICQGVWMTAPMVLFFCNVFWHFTILWQRLLRIGLQVLLGRVFWRLFHAGFRFENTQNVWRFWRIFWRRNSHTTIFGGAVVDFFFDGVELCKVKHIHTHALSVCESLFQGENSTITVKIRQKKPLSGTFEVKCHHKR